MPRIHLGRLALPLLLVVSGLHVILTKMMDSNVPYFWSAPLFYLLFPGEVATMVLTGAHEGGAPTENVMGAIAGILINTCAWVLFLLLVHKVSQRMRGRAA